MWFVCLVYRYFVGLSGLYLIGGKAAVEEDVEFVEGCFPAVVPALAAPAGGVEGERGEVEP
ncbi:hypothetical protein, partial [Streptomyces sp. NPDC057909]|uniref:hypothetical protein n=1 Tax=Streptomyces sp. NPDC057909 TaxID=3346277 RepID=UPI0036EA8386